MTFDSHRKMIGEGGGTSGGAYHLTGIQSAAWHAQDAEGELVRREIRAAAKRRGVAIFDVDGTRLSGEE
jgi:hypothetical protein